MNVLAVVVASFLFIVNNAFAHVVVKPGQVGVGAFQTFTMSVPSERDSATVSLRLVLPNGLESVTPTVKTGWNVEVLKHELPSGSHPYEIAWTGGNIPGHYRDEFTFSARTPVSVTTLVWKAYQTYADGSVVSWDLDPAAEQPKKADGSNDFSKIGPYSKTEIVDDLIETPASPASSPVFSIQNTPVAISSAALLIALASLVVSIKRKK